MEQTALTSVTKLPLFIAVNYFAVVMGHGLWRMTFYNYAFDVLRLSKTEIGLIFSIASIPGTAAFLIGYVARHVEFSRLVGFSVAMMGIGLLLIGVSGKNGLLWVGTLAVAWGFTWYAPLANKAFIQQSGVPDVGVALGGLKSLGPLAMVLATVVVYLFGGVHNTGTLLVFIGIVVLTVGFWAVRRCRRLSFGRRYSGIRISAALWPYYTLNFLAGSRSAIFKTAVISLLVTRYQFDSKAIGMVILFSTLANMVSYAGIGWLTTRLPARRLLAWLYLLVAGVFLGFVFVENLSGFLVLIVIDSLLFGSSVVTDAHLKRGDEPVYQIGDLALGVSAFHLAGVVVSVSAGWMWEGFGTAPVLVLGAAVCLTAAVASFFLVPRGDRNPVAIRSIS